MAHRGKRYVLLIGIMLACLGGAAVWFFTRPTSRDRLERAKSELVARGERLAVEDFNGDGKTNAAPLAALRTAVTNFSDEADWPGSFLAMHSVTAGYARALWLQPEIPLFGEDTGSWSKLESDIEGAESGLKECRETLADPPSSTLSFGGASGYPQAMEWMRAAQWLQGAVILHLHQQELEKALADLLALINAARVYQDDYALFVQLTRHEIGRLALTTTWEALQTPGWTDVQLSQIQNALDQLRFVEPMGPCFEGLRAAGLSFLGQVREQPAQLRNLLGPNRPRLIPERLSSLLWVRMRASEEELCFLQSMQGRIDAARLLAANHNWQTAQARVDAEDFDADQLAVCAALLSPAEGALLRAARLAILQQMAITSLALRRCQLTRPAPPVQLDQLVPEFLAQLPVDYMKGQSLRYLVKEGNNWLLYSVGLDGVDDQGLAGDQTVWEDPWPGADWVWPRAITE